MRIYLIAPRPDMNSHTAIDNAIAGFKVPYAITAAAGIATVAAWFPRHVDLRLCDEIVEPVDFDDAADIIAISANVSQAYRAVDLARAFKARGKTVVMGGVHVTLVPELFREVADCLVLGEFETVADRFVEDMLGHRLQKEYRADKADLALARIPRWDLYPNARAISGVVQTSRGCPFDCSFCDVIQYLGRRQRHKPPHKVIEEAQFLYDCGYREISLSDDNFMVYRQRTRELLLALIAWNGTGGREPVRFSTQTSIDITRTPDILDLCNRAGVRYAFVGLETTNAAALEESGKRQNMRIDLVRGCETMVAAGLSVRAGLIVGFDNDDLSCFERQFEFGMALPVVSFNLNVLVAPHATPLYDEMRRAGRIVDDVQHGTTAGGGSLTNIIPKQMTREQLAEGRNWLKRELLAPDNAMKRFERYAALLGEPVQAMPRRAYTGPNARSHPVNELVSLLMRDAGARRVIDLTRQLIAERPALSYDLMTALSLYLNEYAADIGHVRQ